MERVFEFIKSLTPDVFEVLGYPTIKVYSDYVEVYFDCYNTIRSLSILDFKGVDSFRMFSGTDCITIVYTINFFD